MERKILFRENWLIFLGIWGEAELVLRIWGAKENTFRELKNQVFGEISSLFSGVKGAQTSSGEPQHLTLCLRNLVVTAAAHSSVVILLLQCGVCDQQSLRSVRAYAQPGQSLCKSLEYSMTLNLLTEHHLEF